MRRTDQAEPGDLVIYFGSEWTVHQVADGVAVLRKHGDLEAKGATLRASLDRIRPFVKAADR